PTLTIVCSPLSSPTNAVYSLRSCWRYAERWASGAAGSRRLHAVVRRYHAWPYRLRGGVLERRKLPIFATMVEPEPVGSKAKVSRRSQLLLFGGKAGGLQQRGVFIRPRDRILHRG